MQDTLDTLKIIATQDTQGSLYKNRNGSLQDFAIAKCCAIYTFITANGESIQFLGLSFMFNVAFTNFSDKIQSIKNKKDSNGKMNINDLKKAINEFNKVLVGYIDYEDDYNPVSPKQKLSFDEALPKMFQKENKNQITIVDILKQNFEAVKNAKEGQISFFHQSNTMDLAASFVKINECLKNVDLDQDLATGPFKTIMLYLIQPICQIFKKQEWAKNLIEEKESIKSVPQFKNFATLISNTVSSAKESMSRNEL